MTVVSLALAKVPRSLQGRRGWGSPSLRMVPAATLENSGRVLSPGRLLRAALRHPDEGPTFAPLSGGIPGTTRPKFPRSRQCCAEGTPGWRFSLAFIIGIASLFVFLVSLPALAAQVSDEQVREIAFQLRCVVCQNLSVADSPSETASQMRQIIRERLALGESREQILDYFVSKYGEWILLSPPRRGFNLVVWGLPFAGLLAGLVTIAVVVRRWSRSRREEPVEVADPAYRDRVRRELKELDR